MNRFRAWWRQVGVLVSYGVRTGCGKALLLFVMLGTQVQAGPVTVLAFGDSLTQGFGLVEEDGFVPQLQRWLDGTGAQARVINGGVSGDTTAGGAARVEWSLTPEVDAMILTLGGNDLLRGLDPGLARENLERIIQAVRARDVEILLVGLRAPGNYGAAYKADFDGMFAELARAHDLLLYEDFFAGLSLSDQGAARAYFQADGIHPNADGVARIVEVLGPSVLELVAQVQ